MAKSKLALIIENEYRTDITSKSFWLATILVPVLYLIFSVLLGLMLEDSDVLKKVANPVAPDEESLSGWQIFAMMAGLLLALFLMIYGAQIYSKVRKEKINRIMEVLATSVSGRTMMLGKIISVLLIGMTQLAVWFLLGMLGVVLFISIAASAIPMDIFKDPHLYASFVWSGLFFIGGYMFYGSIYAACGALTDKDNENQGYMTAITFLLLGSFYIEQYAVDNGSSLFVTICSYIPFTAPAVGTVGAITGDAPLWQSISSLVLLFVFAALAISFSGKIYTSSLLLKGRKFSPKDIMLFLKTK